MKKIVLPIFIVFAVAITAMFLFQQPSRYPSSIKTTDGVISISSSLSDDETKKQIKRYILGAMEWNFSAPQKVLTLKMGELKIKSQQGQDDFCIVYPNITTVFEAPEISYSGEHPQLTIQSSCDPSRLEFDFSFLNNEDSLKRAKLESKQSDSSLKFSNWDDETPGTWRIKQIYFSSKDTEKNNSLDLTKYEILALQGRAVEFQLNN